MNSGYFHHYVLGTAPDTFNVPVVFNPGITVEVRRMVTICSCVTVGISPFRAGTVLSLFAPWWFVVVSPDRQVLVVEDTVEALARAGVVLWFAACGR